MLAGILIVSDISCKWLQSWCCYL